MIYCYCTRCWEPIVLNVLSYLVYVNVYDIGRYIEGVR